MGELLQPPSEPAVRTTALILSAGRRRALANAATTEAERDRHEIAAEIQLLAASRAAAEITGEDDG